MNRKPSYGELRSIVDRQLAKIRFLKGENASLDAVITANALASKGKLEHRSDLHERLRKDITSLHQGTILCPEARKLLFGTSN